MIPHWFRPLLLAVALVAACSWVVAPEHAKPKCDIGPSGEDPCPANTHCRDGSCETDRCERNAAEICADGVDNDCDDRVDESVDEECNMRDDDCDGEVDEGISDEGLEPRCNDTDDDCDGRVDEGHDEDGDGVSWCMGQSPLTNDCDPNDRSRFPDNPEVCDGLDNDCDDKTDEDDNPAAPLCTNGQRCLENRCIVPSCGIANSETCPAGQSCINDRCEAAAPKNCDPPCAPGEVCSASLSCIPAPMQPNGAACSSDAECASKTCIDALAIDVPTMRANPLPSRRICGTACCVDEDCPSGEVCTASKTGARSCMPLLHLVGSSKLCSQSCATNQTCAIGKSPDAEFGTTVCRKTEGNSLAKTCFLSDNCASRLCLSSPQGVNYLHRICSTPCGSSKDCEALEKIDGSNAYCRFIALTGQAGYESGYVPACVIARDGEVGKGVDGAACMTNTECADGVCLGASTSPRVPGKCAPTCCKDDQCVSPAQCRPVARGTNRFEMRCVQ